MNRQEAVDLARAVLTMGTNYGERIFDDGVKVEAMALAFATGIEITTNDEKWTPSPQHLTPGTTNFKFATEALACGNLRFTATDLAQLTIEATTDKAAHDACMLIFKTNLKNAEPLPLQLAKWAAADPPRPKPGAHKNKPRDRAIGLAVYLLVQQGFSATRSDASSRNDSACDYVSEALIKEGFGCSFGAVKVVWNNYKHELLARNLP